MWPFKKEPDVYIQRPKRRKLDARGKLVFWALVFGAAVVIVYLATSAKGQTPTTHKVPSIEAFEQLRTDNDNKIATAQATADNAERVAKEALTVITGIDAVLQKLKPTAPNPPYLDVTTDTPLGKHKIGDDITGSLQWSLDNLHEHRRPIVLPCGEWRISKTIRTPYKSGLTLLGGGTGRAIDDAKPGASRFDGARTLLRWTGEPGGTMLELCGNRCEIGNFVLQGNGAGKAIVVTKPEPKGIATATMLFRPLEIEGFETAIQCGTDPGMHNCDNLRFQWLRVDNCKRGYHGVNSMGMNIHFEQLNVGNVSAAIEMDGGGKLSVGKSVIIGPCTLLKVNGGGSVGKNNGYFRLSNTEIDAQAKDGFTLIDSSEPHPIEFYCDGGIQAQMDTYQGTFARLAGGNHLTLAGWDSSFRNITGTRDEKYGRPSVTLRDSRINNKPEAIWQGEIKARWRDCVSVPWKSDSVWLDGEVANEAPRALDFTHGQQLKGFAEQGYVHSHARMGEWGEGQLLAEIERTPIGGHLLIDWEPWLTAVEGLTWYGEATEEENLKMMSRYAAYIRKATPALRARRITPSIYSVPSLMPRNWVRVRGQEGEPLYDQWLKDQHRLIDQAEKSGLLSALRDTGGYVHVIGYLPAEYETNKSAPKWVAAAITNQSRVLDERGVLHRWLFRPSANPELNRVMVEGAKGRCDWWEDQQRANEFAAIGKMLEVSK